MNTWACKKRWNKRKAKKNGHWFYTVCSEDNQFCYSWHALFIFFNDGNMIAMYYFDINNDSTAFFICSQYLQHYLPLEFHDNLFTLTHVRWYRAEMLQNAQTFYVSDSQIQNIISLVWNTVNQKTCVRVNKV